MKKSRQPTINFILAANNAESITRLVVEYSRHLAGSNFHVVVSYPLCDYWDFNVWKIGEALYGSLKRRPIEYQFLRRVIYPAMKALVKQRLYRNSREWAGIRGFSASSRIKLNSYALIPTALNMPDADYMVVMQEYLIPGLVRLPRRKGRIVGGIHLDYGHAIQDESELLSRWWAHNLHMLRQLNVPLWTTSLKTKRSCDDLGIRIDRIIHNGIDLTRFTDGKRRGMVSPVKIMLYCDVRPQKGRDNGIEVIRRLKETDADNILCSSIGHVTAEQGSLFDVNLGWVAGEEYIRAYQESDIFIFPSLYEGFPAPPLDAMACGCALATTKVQGVEEYGVHGENCMMCNPGDVEAMVENVRELISDVSLRDRIRENGVKTAQYFSWERATDELIDFLETCGSAQGAS